LKGSSLDQDRAGVAPPDGSLRVRFVVAAATVTHMRFLRHWPLTAWLFVTAGLAGLLIYALSATQTVVPERSETGLSASLAADRSEVLAVRDALIGASSALAAGPSVRLEWGVQLADAVDALAADRAVRAGAGDDLVIAYRRLADAARRFAAASGSNETLVAQQQLYLRGDELLAVVDERGPSLTVRVPGLPADPALDRPTDDAAGAGDAAPGGGDR
jgi:hypothetical protein